MRDHIGYLENSLCTSFFLQNVVDWMHRLMDKLALNGFAITFNSVVMKIKIKKCVCMVHHRSAWNLARCPANLPDWFNLSK